MSAIPRHVRRTVFQAFSLVMCVLLVATSLPPATQARPAVHETEQPGLRLPLALKEPAAQLTQQGIYTVYLPLVVQNYQPPTPTIAPVSPAAGGVLESADGQVAVSFAPGAVTQTITATYTPLSSIAGIPANQHVVGTAFSLQAQANGVPVARFIPEVVPYTYTNSANHPPLTGYLVTNTVMITMTYSQDQVTGLVEQRLLLHYRDHHNRWVPMLTLVDPQANIAVAPTDHFSDFALLGPTTSTITGTLVILDPDHGGADPGGHVTTPTAYAIEEKTLNLDTALALRDYLETCGVQVLMTREDDSTVAPALRAQFIQQNNPDLALTIAYNVLTTEMSDFFGGPLALADGSKLADWDLGILAADTVYDTTALPINRGVQDARTWRGGVYLPTHVPDTLYTQIELAFIDSYNDRGVIDEQPELFACAAYDTIVTQLELTACLPCSQVRHDERFDRTLGVNQWSRYTAQGVNPVTGNQFQWSRDLFVPGVGLNVDIVRYYNSQTDEAGLFGRGWSSLYDMKLDFLADGAIQVKYADGHRAVFQPGAGGYQAPAGVFEALAAEGGRYVLTTPDQIRFTFDGAGVLQSIADEMDNAITLCYAGVYLDRIEDAGGRIFDVQTDGAGRVTHIIDPSGRVVTYTYGIVSQQCTDYLRGPRGELSTADTPDLLSMTDANGGITGYEYDPTNGYLQYATDPEGITYLDNVYAPDGKVSEQKNGNQDQGSWEYKLEEMQAIFTDNEGNKTTYFFDSKYRVIEEKDALDQSTKYEYDDNDNIIAMTDKQGNTWRYSYDARGNMLTRTDPLDQWSLYDSDVTTWTYDDKNNVTSMTDALGNIWTYKYDDKGNPTEVKEPNGARTTAEYNVKGQMTKLVDAEGRVTEFDYDEHGNRIETRDAEGGWTRSTYDDAGHELARTECLNPPACTRTRTTTNEYDGNGNVTKTIDPMNEKTTFEYDGNNMLKKKVDRRGGIWEYDYDDNLNLKWQKDPLNRIWEYTYNKMDKRLTAKDSLGRITKFQYDDIYRLEKVINPKLDEYNYDYDANGNLLTLTDPLNQTTTFVYDATNRRKFVHNAIGGTTEYCYDPLDRITRVFDPRRAETVFHYDSVSNMDEVIDPLGHRVTMGYDRVHNRTELTTGIPSDGAPADGSTTEFKYDGLNREIRRTDPIDRITHTAYDGVGNVVSVTDPMSYTATFEYNLNGWLTRQLNPLDGKTTYDYDEEGNPKSVTDPNGHTTGYDHDLAGQLRKVTDPLNAETEFDYDQAGNQTVVTNGLGYTTVYTYDKLNLVTDERDPLGHVTHYDYDALRRLTGRQDANNLVTSYGYNPLGWLTSVTDANDHITRYQYDKVGNRTAIIDANGITTTFEYNHLNQLIREINPLDKTWEYRYDANGNMIRRVDGKWQATYYCYDKAGQLVATEYGVGAGANVSVTFEYDGNGNEVAMHDWNGAWTYTYDKLNRRTSATDYQGRLLEWTYDAVGNRIGMIYPDGRSIGMDYDPADRLDTLTDAQGRTVEWDYNPLGYITAQANPNGTRVDYTYDEASRLTALKNEGPGAVVIAAYEYTLDAVGNRTRVVEQRAGEPMPVVRDYGYDDLYRLTHVESTKGQDIAYAYDPVGNRLSKSGTPEPTGSVTVTSPISVTYDHDALHAMTRAGATSLGYDDNGNRVCASQSLTDSKYADLAVALGFTGTLETRYAYDYENRMVGVREWISHEHGISVTMVATCTYDGYGRRVEKQVTTALTTTGVLTGPGTLRREYVYDGLEPVAEYEYAHGATTPTLVSHYTYGNGRMVLLERTPAGAPAESYWYHYDGLGSVVALSDEAGAFACQWEYDEYGNQLRGCLTLNHYGYTGQEYDPETALFHFFARYYDADGGTWITQDTYKGDPNDPSTLARYQYVKNNPISFYDPDGRKATQASLEASKLGNRIQGALNEGVGNQAVLCNKNYYYNPMNSGAYLRPDYLYKGTFFDLKPNTYSGLRDGVSSVTKYSSIGLEPGSQWDRWTMNIPRTAVDPKNNILYEVKFKSPGVLAYSQAPKLSQWTNKIASSRTFSAFGKVTLVVGVALSIYDIGSNIYQESKEAGHLTIGKESSKAIGRNVGAWTGGFVGAKIGAAVGGAVGSIIPGVGTAAGALIGGVVGGVTGAIIGSGAGEKIGEWVHDNAGKAKDWIGDQAKKADSWLEDHGLKFW